MNKETISTILNVVDKIYKDVKPTEDDYHSISRKANKGIAFFPVHISDMVDVDVATTVTRGLERVYTSFLLNSMSLRNVTNEDQVIDFIKKHHQNRDYNSATDEMKSAIDVKDAFSENYSHTEDLMLDLTEASISHEDTTKLQQMVREANEIIEDNGGTLLLATITEASEPKDDPANVDYKYHVEEYNSTTRLNRNDVAKYNDAVPSSFSITLYVKHSDKIVKKIDFDMYVKARMHRISSPSMVKHLTLAGERNKRFLNFVKATTGEISFFKDYLLTIKHSKKRAMEAHDRNTRQWSWLRSEKLFSKFKKMFRLKPLLPISTIIITREEADHIKNEFNLDLMNPIVLKEIMSYYHLLGFIVLDMNREFASFLYDGRDVFEEYTFKSLERESRTDNTTRKLTALLSKGGAL